MLLRGKDRRRFLPALATALTLLAAPHASAVTIEEFPLGATPTGIAAGSDGNLYVTTTAPSILRVSPSGAVTARYPVTLSGAPELSQPVFSGGVLWFAITRDAQTPNPTYALGRRLPDGTIGEVGFAPAAAVVGSAGGGSAWTATSTGVSRLNPAGTVTGSVSLPAVPTSLTADESQGLWATGAFGSRFAGYISPSGTLTTVAAASSIAKVVPRAGLPDVWMLGRTQLCCYSGTYIASFAYWLPPGSTGTRIGAGFLTTANAQDLAVGADGNAWITDVRHPVYLAGATRIGRVSSLGRVTAFTAGLADDAHLGSITAGPGDTLWFTDAAGRIGRVTFDRPAVATEAAGDVGQTGATVAATATPRGTPTRVRFVYGTTTSYGQATRWQDTGDGDDGVRRSGRLEGLAAATTYHYRAEISSALGVLPGPDRSFTTAPPPPPPPVPPADVDADGYAAAVDCNDRSARVYPGAPEIPGDRIDQDCDGADEPYERLSPRVNANFHKEPHGRLRATVLSIDDLPAGATVDLRCQGGGCRFDRWTTTTRKAINQLVVLGHMKGSKLRKGAVVELRVTRPQTIGLLVRWTVRPHSKPVVRCLVPGVKKERRC